MDDAYERFLYHFKISVDDLIGYGLKETIFPDIDLVDQAWEACKLSLERREDHWIRGHGRNGSGTGLYKRFYELLLGIRAVEDPNGNYHPKRMLQKVSRTKAAYIKNYQVSHIFGRTKNPVLFCAPWNVVWKPKFLDPFTGHESTGSIREAYVNVYHEHVREKYRKYIYDYNSIQITYFNSEQIKEVINTMFSEGCFLSLEGKVRFEVSVSRELGPL